MRERSVWTGWALILLLGALAIGAYLRLHLLEDQILLDDEWHGLSFVIGKSIGEILGSFNTQDNSSAPYNLYRLLLYERLYWSEWLLRMPALVAGVLTVVAIPWIVARVIGVRVATLTAFLLAISPFLISYSRFSRSYSAVALLGSASVLFCGLWLQEGRKRDALAYATTALAAVSFHPAALPAVGAPLLAGLLAGALGIEVKPSRRSIITAGAGVGLASVLMLLPMLATAERLPFGESGLDPSSLVAAGRMLTGTGEAWLSALVWVWICVGFIRLIRDRPLHAVVLASTIVAAVAALGLARPLGAHNAVVILRYCITLVPLLLFLVAIGLDSVFELRGPAPWLPGLVVATMLVMLAAWSPLHAIYQTPNNFTGHSAFQGAYAPPSWDHSAARHVYPAREITAEEVPRAYHWLAKQDDVKRIIEYPFVLANHNNRFYFYQHVHGKSVMAGYSTKREHQGYHVDADLLRQGSVALFSADQVISQWPDTDVLRLRNTVDVSDSQALRASGADLLVVHKRVWALHLRQSGYAHALVGYVRWPRIVADLEGFGAVPLMEDDDLVVLRLPWTQQPRS